MHENNDLKHVYDMSLFNVDDFDVLLHEILKQARLMLHAEAGTIYMHYDNCLSFNVFQNDALSYEEIYDCYAMLQNVQLPLCDDHKYLAVESFNSQKIIIIDNVYNNEQYDFIGVKEFDQRFNYHSQSLITIPLIHPIENRTLGVLQLLNKKQDKTYTTFTEKDKEILQLVSSFIAIALSKAQTDVEKLEKLNRRLENANEFLEQRIEKAMCDNEKKNAIIFHQSKLISMGEMIGNIAHQWRQPLSTISTIASGLSIELELGELDKEETQNELKHIVETTKHLSNTIDDFRDFYKVQKKQADFNVASAIKKCLSILNASISINHITVILNLDETVQYYGLENEFIQAICNIISNAKDALLGNLSAQEERMIFIELYLEDERVNIKIKDNAKGIPANTLPHIFEQHFTTKEECGGTGLGLFMTKEIIQKHMNGSIKVCNCEYDFKDMHHKGALFVFSLPNVSMPDSNKSL